MLGQVLGGEGHAAEAVVVLKQSLTIFSKPARRTCRAGRPDPSESVARSGRLPSLRKLVPGTTPGAEEVKDDRGLRWGLKPGSVLLLQEQYRRCARIFRSELEWSHAIADQSVEGYSQVAAPSPVANWKYGEAGEALTAAETIAAFGRKQAAAGSV